VPLATEAPQQTFYSANGNSTHIHGTHVPVEEPSTASEVNIKRAALDRLTAMKPHTAGMPASAETGQRRTRVSVISTAIG
jgi:hypothetical protein